MADAVGQLERLKVMHFGDCLMRNEGAKALAAALEAGHESLEELVLGYNEIRLEGGLAVLNVVARKRGLRKVNLNGEGGVQVYCIILASVCVPTMLCSSLPGNCFGEDGCQQIQDFVDSNGLAKVFEALDDDEGSGEEEEEEADDKCEGKDAQEVGDDEEGELVKDKQLQVKGEKIDTGRAVRLVEEELGDVSSASRTA